MKIIEFVLIALLICGCSFVLSLQIDNAKTEIKQEIKDLRNPVLSIDTTLVDTLQTVIFHIKGK